MYLIIFLYICCASAQSLNNTEVSFVYLTHSQQFDKVFSNLLAENSDINLKLNSIKVPDELEFINRSLIYETNPSVIFDFTSNEIRHLNLSAIDIPYIKPPSFLKSFFDQIRRFIGETGKYDAVVFIHGNETSNDIFDGNSVSPLRVIVKDHSKILSFGQRRGLLQSKSSFVVIVASTNQMNTIFKNLLFGAAYRDNILICFTDFLTENFQYKSIFPKLDHIFLEASQCCKWNFLEENCSCPQIESSKMYQKKYLYEASSQFIDNLRDLKFPESNIYSPFKLPIDIEVFVKNQTKATIIDGEYNAIGNQKLEKRRFFKIGIWESAPWAYIERDPETNEIIRSSNYKAVWSGFCIDIIKKLSELMNFDYELVHPNSNSYDSNRRSGNTADLYARKVDFIVADLRVSSRVENFVDFVSPPFGSSGFQIVIRKGIQSDSLFQFSNVLRLEVWYSIAFAAASTAVLIWFLDNYSPVNHYKIYSEQKRKFTLQESVWFALTSFTPQGCGEAPKYPSGRLLFTSYWFFVILIVTVFTANLSAFLTVERMKIPLSSLEELSKQGKIKLLVQKDGSAHKYFERMCEIEKEIFEVYKDTVLLPGDDKKEFHTWDYPVKYMYRDLVDAINSITQIEDLDDIFKMVKTSTIAFAHDSAKVEYELTQNCNLTTIGDVFASQPLAVAVQSGSNLKEELSEAMFILQESHLFELLTAKYWNNSKADKCLHSDDDEPISFQSLEGVFVAIIAAMGLSVAIIINEICNKKNKVRPTDVVPVVANMQYDASRKLRHILEKMKQ